VFRVLCPEALQHSCPEPRDSVAAGAILGDLPPYEAFPIGGTNSVRGYSEGGVGSGRNYVAGTAEMHWPLFKPLEVPPSQPLKP
jgi:outer membrane translocation and assembly module TamA